MNNQEYNQDQIEYTVRNKLAEKRYVHPNVRRFNYNVMAGITVPFLVLLYSGVVFQDITFVTFFVLLTGIGLPMLFTQIGNITISHNYNLWYTAAIWSVVIGVVVFIGNLF